MSKSHKLLPLLLLLQRFGLSWNLQFLRFSPQKRGRHLYRQLPSTAAESEQHHESSIVGQNPGDDDDHPNHHCNRNKDCNYTLEYSLNFHRHLIRNSKNGSLVQSFWWKDDALAVFPNATLLPLAHRVHRGCIAPLDSEDIDLSLFFPPWAGDVADASLSYPVRFWNDKFEEERWREKTNGPEIYSVLERRLTWFPSQVDNLLTLCPKLLEIPASLLEERFQFLLSPLPDLQTIQKVNTTEDIDWPLLFECFGYGAGMSVAQLSHALQTSPEPFLLRNTLTPLPIELNPHQQLLLYRLARHSTVANDIVPMTKSVLDLWVAGVSYNDILTFSYLHHLGWEWSTFRIVLHALPACHQYHVEESLIRSSGGTKQKTTNSCWNRQAMQYLTLRMQLRPWLIQAMLKTHRNLVYYRLPMLQRSLDYLQQTLLIRSTHLRKLVLLTPTLLGISPETMDARIKGFWNDIIGLGVDDLRKLALKSSALLEYNTDQNLVSTNVFFRETLRLTPQQIIRITKVTPMVWGRSKDKYYDPLLNLLQDKYTISAAEYGTMIARAPELVAYNAKTLEERLDFLGSTEAGFTPKQVREMVLQTPRILKENIQTSMLPKLLMIRRYYNHTTMNPNWLLAPLSKFNETSGPTLPKVTKRSIVSTWAGNQTIDQVFESAKIAAEATNRSRSAIYKAIRLGTMVDNRILAYAGENAEALRIISKQSQEKVAPKVSRSKVKHRTTNVIESPTSATIVTATTEGMVTHDRLVILTDGRAFPPEDLVRGRPRSGGLSLQIHGWDSWKREGGKMWKGRRSLLLADQTLLLDYPYIRPSHRRCSIYVCREALRLSSLWIGNPVPSTVDTKAESATSRASICELSKLSANNGVTDKRMTVREVIIGTESHDVAQTLSDPSLLIAWGSLDKKEDFLKRFGSMANADLLHPLARTVYDLVSSPNQTVKVSFVHHSTKTLCEGAKLAARMTYYGRR